MPAKETRETTEKVYELMWGVRRLTRATLLLQQVIAEDMGLHATDAECLDFLMEMGPSTAGALARATRLTTGAITSVIDRLEKAGLVKRDPDPGDRRKVIVTYLGKKEKKSQARYGLLARDLQRLFSGYDAATLEMLIRHTGDVTAIYQQVVEKIGSEKK
jgi:DNA-binding MarR family transcriptional regulator